jgi:hypothetical protein
MSAPKRIAVAGATGRVGRHDPADPAQAVYESGALLPGPDATLAGPTFEAWLDEAV